MNRLCLTVSSYFQTSSENIVTLPPKLPWKNFSQYPLSLCMLIFQIHVLSEFSGSNLSLKFLIRLLLMCQKHVYKMGKTIVLKINSRWRFFLSIDFGKKFRMCNLIKCLKSCLLDTINSWKEALKYPKVSRSYGYIKSRLFIFKYCKQR